MGAQISDAAQKNLRRVVLSSIVGALIEWYDFFLYGVVAGIVFNKLFFPAVSPVVGTIMAFATFAVGFVARPLGGIIFGHFGDKIGRKKMLIITLEIMGVATVAIGCIPSYDSIGIWAPILLVVCRLAQGIGLGGEWGGAVLMAFESAPAEKRAFYGALPQIGNPLGLMLATGIIGILSYTLSNEDFLAWGWRIAFILCAILVFVGAFIRNSVEETQDFSAVKKEVEKVRYPMITAFKRYPRTLFACMGARFVEGIAFNVFGVFSLSYLTQTCGVPRTLALTVVMAAAFVMACCIPFWGAFACRVGKGKIFGVSALLLGVAAYPAFWVLHHYSNTSFILVYPAVIIPLGVIYSAAYASMASLFSDAFDPTVRYSSISFVYQFSGIFASGITPMIATILVQANNSQPWYLCGYLLIAGVISALATVWLGSIRRNKVEPLPMG